MLEKLMNPSTLTEPVAALAYSLGPEPKDMSMDLSKNTQIILRRFKTLNCVTAGQVMSIGMFQSDFGGLDHAKTAMKAVMADNLVAEGPHGTYMLTSAGAEALSKSTFTQKSLLQSRMRSFSRPPVNKLQ